MNGTLTGVARYLRDANGKEPSAVESIVDGNTETVYLLFGVDPTDSVKEGYMRKLVVTKTVGDTTVESMIPYHATGKWGQRFYQNWVSIAVPEDNSPVTIPE